MKFKDFMDLYENWNGTTVVNDDDLNPIIKCKTSSLMFAEKDTYLSKLLCTLLNMEVVSFGFYDNELCVRVK